MKVGVLTSSRADFGIYLPLLKALRLDNRFELSIIAFGMHLQHEQGYTLTEIELEGFEKVDQVGEMPEKDEVLDIAIGYGKMTQDFARYWSKSNYDFVLALGDRWEMSAAVQATIPFEIKIAHIHGGETTLGAIDNIYRHQITLASTLHFTAAEPFSSRVAEIKGSKKGVCTVGSISLEEFDLLDFPSWAEVKKKFEIPFDEFVLVTIHPESVGHGNNLELAQIAYQLIEQYTSQFNFLITQANSDALGSLFNKAFRELEKDKPEKVKLVKSMGKLNYFSAINACIFMLGNTSSGIIESASFKKWVVNIGDRQKGRLRSGNVIDVPFDQVKIAQAMAEVSTKEQFNGKNKYKKEGTIKTIIKALLSHEEF